MKEKEILFNIELAKLTATRSYANRAKVGAVVVKSGQIISSGYNGTYAGDSNQCETDDGEKTLPNVIHAEKNAIMKVCKSNNSTNESSIFITHAPCNECASLISLSGIKEVYFNEYYNSLNFGSGIELLKSMDIKIYKVNIDNEKIEEI